MKKSNKKRTASARASIRPLHKKIALNPVVIFMVLCAGGLLISWTLKASADASTTYGQGASTNVVVRISSPNPSIATSSSSVECHISAFDKLINFITVSDKQCHTASISTSAPAHNYKWLWMAWPAYSVIAVTSAAIWIGEQQGSIKLARLARSSHHNRHAL